jgi:hypothetical protein
LGDVKGLSLWDRRRRGAVGYVMMKNDNVLNDNGVSEAKGDIQILGDLGGT